MAILGISEIAGNTLFEQILSSIFSQEGLPLFFAMPIKIYNSGKTNT